MDKRVHQLQSRVHDLVHQVSDAIQGSKEDLSEGSNGFEDLRKHIKQGNEFCVQISNIMTERSEAEGAYAKVLSKLSQKLQKVAGTCLGTLSDAWSLAGVEMDAESDLHKQLSQSLIDDLSKPIKNLAEQQTKSRKPIESRVEKSQKSLADRRAEENKLKKLCFTSAKEREKTYDQMVAAKAGKGKNTTDKDISKMEKKGRSLEDALRKQDKEYLEASEKAETSRQEWELCIYRASGELQKLEEERISQLQDFLNKYNSHLSVIGPKMIRSCDKLGEAVLTVDMNSDIRKVVDAKGTGPNQPEQILPDFYAEDALNTMDKERRRQALQNYMIYLQQDIERELKGKDGVEKLLDTYKNKPHFADAETEEDSRQKLHQVTTMICFLEASLFKITCAMSDVDGRSRPSSKFQNSIERTKDKQGQSTSILRTPAAIVTNGYSAQSGSAPYRAPADGGHVDTYAEASEKRSLGAGSFRRQTSKPSAPPPPIGFVRESMVSSYSDDEFDDGPTPLCSCRAIYDYTAQQQDELTIRPGDVISVYEKQADGWWQGELNSRVGIFPATYVEELSHY